MGYGDHNVAPESDIGKVFVMILMCTMGGWAAYWYNTPGEISLHSYKNLENTIANSYSEIPSMDKEIEKTLNG